MTTRRHSTSDNLLPRTDPEALIRAANAERRRLAQIKSGQLTSNSSSSQPIAPLPFSSTTQPGMSEKQASLSLASDPSAANITAKKSDLELLQPKRTYWGRHTRLAKANPQDSTCSGGPGSGGPTCSPKSGRIPGRSSEPPRGHDAGFWVNENGDEKSSGAR
ncbi:hypothetical protein PTTG_29507 [Puccinia triticina 1-1 BBBD Race 1]|uniref:Uncharacterized protein n=1 Tax=Puccinia triticina (isolate 1-1 / race 1 (BBBD)) TaxID=630390 RepID=A0A180G4A3_PUCT1|nr:hypothetical protein PTTG_29507 [Puccinia triticina 1-1 BBBD Race 1]